MGERPVTEEILSGRVAGTLLRCADATTGVVVLGGSSGRVDVARARLFAGEGASALALQWFGGEGQVPGICEIPLEIFFAATDHFVGLGCRRIVYVGTSKGAEAALLAAAHDRRIDAVAAISPTSVVWGNIGPGRDGTSWPERSSWTLKGVPLPFVPTEPNWRASHVDGLVSYRGLFEHCLASFKQEADKAAIPVEAISAQLVLVAGGDDALWPSLDFARSIVRRREDVGKATRLVSNPDAGHRILLPGETTPRSALHAHGGNDQADARLGRDAWELIRDLL
ncbi:MULTISPECIES: acyl-CoA thioester hydrolase/BAAT C-terminal domain-containing protein [unclassified Mesorhizobium]|uniref:acyl-CoA thioester hydrolase/BAAT C-terminal domain-containing protein n=1 Tax=unclassified Mesorhizobium TaxID=325217 RepID=UPI000BAFB1E1|nr:MULTISPECIES: acyl-CoA thioester hydrolase/BAAT C-terminal domain-containing protein [unclassified Mesorhizobium]PBB23851.1 acyl-CoA thioesterase [Mesorhizobium sp. WSM4304]PBB72698.1 acyl-CoA thioesterase [Mesorhizobium sp. WSM4308]